MASTAKAEVTVNVDGRQAGKTLRAARDAMRSVLPIEPTGRTQPSAGLTFRRATAGHVVWRDVPSAYQQRTPSTEAQPYSLTKEPPWVRKRRVRRRNQLARASRKANRA